MFDDNCQSSYSQIRPLSIRGFTMPYIDLEPGDIIIIRGMTHAVMWVGDIDQQGVEHKPLVHNITKGKFVGVIRQSTGGYSVSGHPVFRCDDPAMALKAAGYAVAWATTPGQDFQVPEDLLGKQVILKSPYSMKRLEASQYVQIYETPIPWTVDSLFRVIKAIARRRDNMGLSPNHGVSCSQFVTFCYQAAALEDSLGGLIPNTILNDIRQTVPTDKPFDLDTWKSRNNPGSQTYWRHQAYMPQQKVFKSLKQDQEFIVTALEASVEATRNRLPRAMRVDAKRTNADWLERDLGLPDSGFRKMGVVDQDDNNKFAIRIT
jgi:hypothetical protein